MLSLIFSLVYLFASEPREAQAYPNMVRHGYTTCVTCHFNASGGGSLRSYGKFVAGETMGVLNTSESALPWIKTPAENEVYGVSFMGRTVQTLFDTPQLKRGDFRRMQADIEVAVDYKTWVGIVTVGPRLDSAVEGEQSKSNIFVRRFYLGKQAKNYSVKIGKFFPEYGIYVPNHNVPTRKGLFFNHNQEPWIAQGSYFTPSFDFTVAHIRAAKASQYEQMTGFAGTLAYKTGSMRFGVSRLHWGLPESPKETGATSLFATVGYAGVGYTMLEVARKTVTNIRGRDTATRVAYFESGWEFYKGLIPYISWEYTKNVTTQSLTHSPSIGVQLGLVTHVEIVAQVSKLMSPTGNGHALFSMFNLYF